MSDRIVLNDRGIGQILARAAHCEYGDLSTNIARVKNQKLLGGAIYQGYTGESCIMHLASFHPRWLSKGLCWVGHHYPFEQLGVQRIFGQVPEDNWQARRLNEHGGFRTVARIEGVYRGGVACLVMVLEKKDSRFLRWPAPHFVEVPRKLLEGV